ncbi:hypothetical protein GCM10012279_25070 [Micromonospora yangpuensis]|uniref:AraC-type DNA-binding protein n=1 Tax=Micromonospora yangpuensis TaxID=683228 RepID=A0A1C6UEK5_9ACTN|nr:hypothetical protein GCM10012279_25070 [Micromonospora yangpuensis]SCL52500.1 AraC-type DNA-binding protein [Micromonospora yangpuensis]
MVTSGQPSPATDIAPGQPDLAPEDAPTAAGIDTPTLDDLATHPDWRRPTLVDADLLVLVTDGHGSVELDFRPVTCRPGTLLRVGPGQALRCVTGPSFEALVVRWRDGAPAGQPAPAGRTPAYWPLDGDDGAAIREGIRRLAADLRRYGRPPADRQRRVDPAGGPQSRDGGPNSRVGGPHSRVGGPRRDGGSPAEELLRHQLAVLLLRLALLAPEPPSTGGEQGTFERLCRELERGYRHSRRVEDYATRLGCSVRTLTRACLAVTGRSAKQVIDERVALQASRLLAATDEPIAEIGRHLGFPEPTNFGRFFTREVGHSPGAFRAAREQWTSAGDRGATSRDRGPGNRDRAAGSRDLATDGRDRGASSRDLATDGRDRGASSRDRGGDGGAGDGGRGTADGDRRARVEGRPGTRDERWTPVRDRCAPGGERRTPGAEQLRPALGARSAATEGGPARIVRPRPPAERTGEPDRA